MKDIISIKDKKNFKREKIIEAASILFSEKNYHEVMMEDVAKAASLAKGTIYNYFPSKEDLYFSIMNTRMENLIFSLKEKIENEKNPYESLRIFIGHIISFFVSNSCFFLMLQRESLNKNSELCTEVKNRQSELKQILIDIVINGKNNNCFNVTDENLASDLVLGAINGAVSFTLKHNNGNDLLSEKYEEIFNYLLNGFLTRTMQLNGKVLINKQIVITRSVDDSNESAEKFRSFGAKVISFPTIDVIPPDDWTEFDKNVVKLNEFDFLIFTSANAVRMFSKRCSELDLKPDFSGIKTAVIGKKTFDECARYNMPVNILPQEFTAKGLLAELSKYILKGKKVFIPGSAIAREELPLILKENGVQVTSVPVYNLGIPSKDLLLGKIDELNKAKPDLFIFTSPSTYRNFLKVMNISKPGEYFGSIDIAVIGPTTKSEVESSGVNVSIIPKEYTIDGLLNSVINYYSLQ